MTSVWIHIKIAQQTRPISNAIQTFGKQLQVLNTLCAHYPFMECHNNKIRRRNSCIECHVMVVDFHLLLWRASGSTLFSCFGPILFYGCVTCTAIAEFARNLSYSEWKHYAVELVWFTFSWFHQVSRMMSGKYYGFRGANRTVSISSRDTLVYSWSNHANLSDDDIPPIIIADPCRIYNSSTAPNLGTNWDRNAFSADKR